MLYFLSLHRSLMSQGYQLHPNPRSNTEDVDDWSQGGLGNSGSEEEKATITEKDVSSIWSDGESDLAFLMTQRKILSDVFL